MSANIFLMVGSFCSSSPTYPFLVVKNPFKARCKVKSTRLCRILRKLQSEEEPFWLITMVPQLQVYLSSAALGWNGILCWSGFFIIASSCWTRDQWNWVGQKLKPSLSGWPWGWVDRAEEEEEATMMTTNSSDLLVNNWKDFTAGNLPLLG